MTRAPWILVRRHLLAHWVRTGSTVLAMAIAVFLFCMLVSIVTTLDAAVEDSSGERVVVSSAVSLFVSLPLDYQEKIRSVPGVETVSKFQWFGAYWREPSNFFANFGVDHDVFFEQYRKDIEIVEGPAGERGEAARSAVLAAMVADRRACLVGTGLVRDYGFKVGSTVPLTGTIFQKADGSAWDFNVVGVYRPLKANVDDRTLFFRFDYLDENLRAGTATGPRGAGTYSVEVAPGADSAGVIAGIDGLFANGPQATRTQTEAAFQAGFVSMMGNLPVFVGTIGGAVVFAVFFSLVNTMLMAARQRLHEVGILKALGFASGTLAALVLVESLALSLAGAAIGAGLAVPAAIGMRQSGLGTMFPSFHVAPATVGWAIGLALVIGIVAGLAPAFRMARLEPTEALRSEA